MSTVTAMIKLEFLHTYPNVTLNFTETSRGEQKINEISIKLDTITIRKLYRRPVHSHF